MKVKESPKTVLQQLYSLASVDTRTVTGANLRSILLLTNQLHVDHLTPSLVGNIPYNMIDKSETWRISLAKELIDIKSGDLKMPEGWSREELDSILNEACTK